MMQENNFFPKKLSINCRGMLLDLSIPKILGIVNVTPDSFFDGGKYSHEKAILKRVEHMVKEGVDIIDIGAYSSRPKAENISEEEELNRLCPVLEIIKKNFSNVLISVDTFRSIIAKRVVSDYGVDIINDVSAGNLDANMFDTIAELNVPYIIMHMQGNPQIMQDNPYYKDLMKEIVIYFADKVEKLKQLGVNDVIIDPGFGFGKTLEHNYESLGQLDLLKIFQLPIMVGVSRKSMIFKLLDLDPKDALNGTTVLHTIALLNGANMLRVHDVKEAVEVRSIIMKHNSVETLMHCGTQPVCRQAGKDINKP